MDINTRFITLIGSPLAQSFAARMQNAAYAAAGWNMAYFYTETGTEHLGEILAGIRYMPAFIGCAVTKPNKVAVLPYLDAVDELAGKVGACNTIVKTGDGRLTGFNTDGVGFYLSLTKDAGIRIEGSTFFCFGAGGAGRAITAELGWRGAARIYVTDVNEAAGRSLAEDTGRLFGNVAEFIGYGDFSRVAECDVVINASGIGMGRSVGESPLPERYIRPGQFYFDACYNPTMTRFLENAAAKGCRVLNGLNMSLYQGAEQIRLWTGKEPPMGAMRRELLTIISEGGTPNECPAMA